MEYHLLKEDPVDSGVYVDTGEKLTSADPFHEAATLTQTTGTRHAIYPYETLNLREPAPA